MRFLIDAQLPPVLVQWLQANGHEARHVGELNLSGADDHVIWQQAVSDDAVLLTKDEDFVAIRQGIANGPAVCWLRIGNATNPTLLTWFSAAFPKLLTALLRGEKIIELK